MTLQIAAVEAATCVDHADVIVAAPAGAPMRVRVDAPSARAILSEINGLPSEHAIFIDLLRLVLEAQGGRVAHVEVSGGNAARGCIFFATDGESPVSGVRGIPASVALLIAAHLGVPIYPSSAQAAPGPKIPLPEAIQQFLDELAIHD